MTKNQVSTFVEGIDALMNKKATSKKVKISITALISGAKVTVYTDEIEADELQTSGYDAFRREVNDLTTYHKGKNIKGMPCTLTMNEFTFEFDGGKFVSNLNLLSNGVIVRNGMLGKKHGLKKEAKVKFMDSIVPKDSNLMQWIAASSFLDGYTDAQIKQAASALQLDRDGELIIEAEQTAQIEVNAE